MPFRNSRFFEHGQREGRKEGRDERGRRIGKENDRRGEGQGLRGEEFKKESYKAKIISAIRLLAHITLLVNRIYVTNLV